MEGAGRVRRGGLLTELTSAPETHLKDIWDWGISGEHGGKVIVNKGEHMGARGEGAGMASGGWRRLSSPWSGGVCVPPGIVEPLLSWSEWPQIYLAEG